MESQEKQILNYLQNGNKLTAIDALNRFNCFRLASRINNLRKTNTISDIWIESNNKRFKCYYIKN